MAMLISPTEPSTLKDLLKGKAIVSSIPEKHGADILSVVPGKGIWAVQRKTFPDDLIVSVGDGRLSRGLSLLALTEYPVLIIEGRPMWTTDGHLMQSWSSRWTRSQLRNLLRSVWKVHGIAVEYTDDISDTATAVLELDTWFRKDVHHSLLARSKQHDSWGKRQSTFFYQGIDGVGVELARNLMDRFATPSDLCEASLEELGEVPLIGKKRAKDIYEFLHGERR